MCVQVILLNISKLNQIINASQVFVDSICSNFIQIINKIKFIAVTISGVKPNQHFVSYYLTAEATVPSEANLEQISSSISTSVNNEGNNNNKTYQVSFSGTFSYYLCSCNFLYENGGGGGRSFV